MTIKEVEEQTGLTRSNIRFYEKEKLIEPARNDKNGYRDYSESDVENIKKIAYLRTLEISIEDIRNIMSDQVSLTEIIEKQAAAIQTQNFVFMYPLACIIIRIFLRPVIYVRWLMNFPYGELIREYLSNYLCFIALSLEY